MTTNETTEDIITTLPYEESNPIFQKIKKDFASKLKEKYQCEDYESIIAYVFDFVFVKKNSKKQCIEQMNVVFNNKADGVINYLWEITKKYENEKSNESNEENQQDEEYQKGNNFSRRGGKNARGRDMKKRGKPDRFNKYYKNYKNERSRSGSHERSNKYDYDEYQPYPPQQKGYYPPNPRFGPMMPPMRGGYPAYYPPQMMPPYLQR